MGAPSSSRGAKIVIRSGAALRPDQLVHHKSKEKANFVFAYRAAAPLFDAIISGGDIMGKARLARLTCKLNLLRSCSIAQLIHPGTVVK